MKAFLEQTNAKTATELLSVERIKVHPNYENWVKTIVVVKKAKVGLLSRACTALLSLWR